MLVPWRVVFFLKIVFNDLYTWNLFVPCFWVSTKKAVSNQYRGHLGST